MTPVARSVIAVDAGGTKISAGVIDSSGQIHRKEKLSTSQGGAQESIRQIVELLRGLGCNELTPVGLIVPGIYYADTGKVWAPNIPGWEHIDLRSELTGALRAPIFIDSDRVGYVLGEQWMGVAKGLRDVVFLAVGTGIGAGIISGGKLIRGAGDIAGSVGWFALNPKKKEIYKKVGCFEAEAAGPSLARRAGMSAVEVVFAARQGDARALGVIEETARYLAMGVANLVSLLNPEMVVLGGGLMQAGDLLLETTRREVLDWAQPIAAGQVRIELSALGEDAGLLGAARLALTATMED